MKKRVKTLFIIALSFAFFVAVIVVSQSIPIITGYGAKILSSEVFIAGRASSEVIANDLGSFPSNLCNYEINLSDSSATASVLGFAKKEAIFRKEFGCTLVNGITKETLRQQHTEMETVPMVNQDTIPWPTGNKAAFLVPPGVDFERCLYFLKVS